MLYQESSNLQKGLFTFYLEQYSHEQALIEPRKSREIQIQQKQGLAPPLMQAQRQFNRKQSIVKAFIQQKRVQKYLDKPLKQKQKLNRSKERLRQSIIELGKISQLAKPHVIHKSHLSPISHRQKSQILRRSSVLKNLNEAGSYKSQQNVNQNPEQTVEQFNLNSIKRNKLTQKTKSAYIKDPLSTSKDFLIELPEIKQIQQAKKILRPKKSIKSKLIQQALHTGDRVRIKQIREYLRSESPYKLWRNSQIQDDSGQNSLRAFEIHQMKIMQILQKCKRQ